MIRFKPSGRTLLASTCSRKISVKKVSGEKKYTNLKAVGRWCSETNTPPMNNKGNLMIFMRIMISEVISLGLADTNSAKKDPKIPISAIPIKIINNESGEVNTVGTITTKTIAMIEVMMVEYRVDARIIPIKISFNDIGELNKRSSDFSRVSIGNTTGAIAVEVKKEVIATIPMKICAIVMVLPRIKEITKNKGNIKPNIKTGPLFT